MSENVLRWIVTYYQKRSNLSSLSDDEFKRIVIYSFELDSIEKGLSKEEQAELSECDEYKGLLEYIKEHELWD